MPVQSNGACPSLDSGNTCTSSPCAASCLPGSEKPHPLQRSMPLSRCVPAPSARPPLPVRRGCTCRPKARADDRQLRNPQPRRRSHKRTGTHPCRSGSRTPASPSIRPSSCSRRQTRHRPPTRAAIDPQVAPPARSSIPPLHYLRGLLERAPAGPNPHTRPALDWYGHAAPTRCASPAASSPGAAPTDRGRSPP